LDNWFISWSDKLIYHAIVSWKYFHCPPSIPPHSTEAWKIPGIQSEAKGIKPVGGRVASSAHGKKCLLLAHAKGVLGGLGGVANGLGGRVEDRLALLGGVVGGAGDRVGGLLGGALLARGLGRACNVVGGTLDGVTSLLEARLLGVGLQAGGSLVGGGLAAGWLLANVTCRKELLLGSTNRASDILKVMFGG
jgi:hypothetical protein